MRLSRYFLPILRETPKEAEIVSHRLMLQLRYSQSGIGANDHLTLSGCALDGQDDLSGHFARL